MNSILQHRYLTLSKKVDALARQAKELAEVAEELCDADKEDRTGDTERTLSRIYVDLDELAEDLAQKGGA